MRKVLPAILALLLSVVALIGLTSCGEDPIYTLSFVIDGEVYTTVETSGSETVKLPTEPTKEGYTFGGWYFDIDIWKMPFTTYSLLDMAPLTDDVTVYGKWDKIIEHVHTPSDWVIDKEPSVVEDGFKHKECESCGEILETEALPKTTLLAPDFTAGVKGLSTTVSHDTEVFIFPNAITVTNDAEWLLSSDQYGEKTIITKTVALKKGDNTYYIHIIDTDNEVYTYKLNIYKKSLYTVQFDTVGGSAVAAQDVEEGSLATPPITTKQGYTFSHWDFNFRTPIITNLTIKANWTPNTDTPYKVEYYLQNSDRNGYTIFETDLLRGTTDATVNATEKTYSGYRIDRGESILSGVVAADGSLTLKVYYNVNYTVSNSDAGAGTITGAGTYAPGTTVNITAQPHIGYLFDGWYSGDYVVSYEPTYVGTINDDIEARFIVDVWTMGDALAFTSTLTECTVTGLNYTNVTDITIPNCVGAIADNAFKGCVELEAVIIPESVTSIGAHAFDGCVSLTTIYYYYTDTEWKQIAKGEGWDNNTGNYTFVYNHNRPYYTITFITYTQPETIVCKVYVGEKITAPQAPDRASYVFDGWVIADTGERWDFTVAPTEDMTFEAVWDFGLPPHPW